jgi:hypothetical protein
VSYPGANYPAGIGPWVTLPSINTTEYSNIRLEFQRWLGVRSGDSGRMRYSVNGSFFLTEIALHSNLIDTGWSAQTYNLQSNAAGIESVVINIEMNSDSTDHSFGWNIDDLKLTGIANFGIPPRVTSAAPAAALQGQMYSQTIATVDADTAGSALVFTATGLPAGIALTPNGTGGATLSGTSMTAGASTFLLSVSDGTYTTRKSYSLVTIAQTAPNTPTGLSASAVSATALSLSWSDVANDETGYVVERSTSSGSGFTNIASLPAGASSYSDTLLPLGTTYFYRVMAVKGLLTSSYSNVTSVTTWSLLQKWRADNSLPVAGTGTGANLGDPDSDGVENLLEYAFGANPNSSTGDLAYISGGAVTAAGKPMTRNLAAGFGVDYRAIFSRRKDRVAAGLTYTVQFSAGLDVWVNSTATPTVLTGAGGENPAEVEAVSVPYPLLIPVAGDFKKPTFFRVVVTLDP